MILVDSSVWIDYFRGTKTPQTERLHSLLGAEPLAIGDLILMEVLQGFSDDSEFAKAKNALTAFSIVDVGGRSISIQAAQNYRRLRRLGITVRKTVDVLIATRCIESGYHLLHDDRDFDAFAEHLGLQSVV